MLLARVQAPPAHRLLAAPVPCVGERAGAAFGSMPYARSRRCARFPLNPFLGLMGVAVDSDQPIRSVPPGSHGGNLDVNLLGVGSTLYLPVEVEGALFDPGDPT